MAPTKADFASRRKYLTLSINSKPIRLHLGTVSDITLILRNTWQILECQQILLTELIAKSAYKDVLELMDQVEHQFNGVCFLTNHRDLNLLGLDWLDKLNLSNVLLNSVCLTCHLPQMISFHTMHHVDLCGNTRMHYSSRRSLVTASIARDLQL
ncbi:unnamed protein product [Trichobilharzia regenti]|nr:unnamed protein product [Trichobilharzia regenti]